MSKRITAFSAVFILILVVNLLGPILRVGIEALIEAFLLACLLPFLMGGKAPVREEPKWRRLNFWKSPKPEHEIDMTDRTSARKRGF